MSERGAASGRVFLVGGALAAVIGVGIAIGLVTTGGGSDGPSVTPTPTTPASTAPATTTPVLIKSQVRAAYLTYWKVYSHALLRLDGSNLDQVLTGSALRIVRKQIHAQRGKDQPVRISVEHHLRLKVLTPTKASVDDRYVDNSVRLDPKTMKPTESPPHARVHHSYTLKLVNGTWKVSFIIGYK
jgi:hypothetical protein